MKKITVLLADDHTVVRQGLRRLLAAETDIEVVGEAADGREAVELAHRLKPDVIVMDISMPRLNGLEATRQIIAGGWSARLLILSAYSDSEYVHQFTAAGASGYVIKETPAGDVIHAIREISRGNAYFSPTILKRLLEYYRESCLMGLPLQRRGGQLTSREQEVLQLVAEGQANKQIAAALGVSIKTVEKHRQQLMNKLNIHEIAGLTRYAISQGVVENQRHGRAVLGPVKLAVVPASKKAGGAGRRLARPRA